GFGRRASRLNSSSVRWRRNCCSPGSGSCQLELRRWDSVFDIRPCRRHCMRSCINLARENMSSARGQATIVCRVLFLAGACLLSHDSLAAQEVSWTTLVEGLAVTVWEPGTRCKEASPLLLVKVDPERFRFSTYHFLDEGLSAPVRSEEHTSELQSRFDLVCRLLLEKKK